ncbi:NAD(P)H-binding protein [Phaeacidiphilus oryzae]|uniref:NAD(P)H-binding protein n=1 Tax=Phaeacidiphilus oryzae TaxID=348818 RepID=UPI00055A11F6|nr:NAD(P)H-binding protein [Phaeacidiphilus oryzae]
MTIAVTGGNGAFGSAVLAHLRHRTDERLVATVRDVAGSAAHPPRHEDVAYRFGDFDDPAALRTALADVDTVLLNATFFGPDPGLRLPRVTAAVGAAADAGVRRIVLTSWPDLPNATVPVVQDYHRLEAAVREAGPDWTVLRLSAGIADAIARDVVWGRSSGEVVAPAAGARATPAAADDLGDAAAAVLAEPERHRGRILELTGPDAIGWEEVAKAAGVPFRAVGEEEYLRHVRERFGVPESTARQLVELYRDFRGPWGSTPTATLTELTGRPALPAIEAVRQRVAAFPAG